MPSTTYSVSIDALSKLTDESKGFIDPKKVEQYMAEDGDAPATVATSRLKERGNIRYDMMIGSLGLMGNVYVSNVVATDATVDAAPSNLSFTLTSEHGEECLVTPDEENEGETLVGADAIKRVIARTLLGKRIDSGDYYDPSTKSGIVSDGTTVNAVRMGTRIEDTTVEATCDTLSEAEAAITVTLV